MMRIPRSTAVFGIAAALGTIALPSHLHAQAADTALKVEPCSVPDLQGPARCGTLQVWENRATRSGRRIPIHFIVVPAPGGAPAKEAVVYFSGGPGQAATEDVPFVTQELSAAREGRDLLFIDLRGTGRSNPLPCEISKPNDLQSYMVEFFTVEGVQRCARDLQPRADVTLYTSAHAVDDVEELRTRLGYERVDLDGGSYGTRAALVYLRRHPAPVRAILMHGAVPTDIRYPLTVAADAQAAIEGVFADCARDAGCHAAFPDPAADLRESLRRLEAGPVEATVISPLTGEPATVRLPRDRFAEALRYMTYDAGSSSLIPALVHASARGDFGPAAEQALFWRRNLVSGSSRGLYLAVTCPEDVAWVDSAEAARLAQGTYLGMSRVIDQKAACTAWPYTKLDPSFVEPIRSDVPVLVMSGQWDPATAPYHAERMLRGFPNGRRVLIPSAGHGTGGLVGVGPCYSTIITQFIRTADAKAVDATCMQRVHRPPFPTQAPPTRVVAVDSATLARYAGHYTGEGGFTVDVRVSGGRLHQTVFGRDMIVLPVGPGRFRLADDPNRQIRFVESGGVVTGMEVTFGGGEPDRLTRVSQSPVR